MVGPTGMYGTLPYVLCKSAAWMVVNGGANVLFVALTFFMAGSKHART
jgi:hypothetical protein